MPALRLQLPRTGVLVPVALATAAAGLLLGGPAGPEAGIAGDRYEAGDRASERVALAPSAAARVRAAGLRHAAALGLPAGTGTQVARVVDRFDDATFDEVVTTDAAGGRLSLIRMSPDGRLAAAVRLGWRVPVDRPIGATEAVDRAAALAAAAGVPALGTPAVAPVPDGGWRVTWPRTVADVPVLGDGTSVTVFGDGTIHAAAVRERPLAPAPPTEIDGFVAERIARERLVELVGKAAAAQVAIVDTRRAWVAPNDTFDASAPDAPASTLRLAWVIEASRAGCRRAAPRPSFLDAGTGALLGGDLLR
jgi:hypothetical protein